MAAVALAATMAVAVAAPLALLPADISAAPLPALADTPAWVSPVAPDPTRTVKNAVQGMDYLLADSQTRVAPDGTRQNFRHFAMRVRTTKGLDHAGQVDIEWDPTYQRLQLHQIRVLRDGRWLPWRDRVSARTLDREPEAEQRIYDGRKTLLLQLDDIRVGDVLEYAYTVNGWNPVYAGKQFGGFSLDYGSPVARIHNRLVWPTGRDVVVRASPGTPEPRRSVGGGQQELVWDATDVPAVQREDHTPSWFDPWSEVRWTEFRDWGDVARWGAPLYQPPAKLSPALRAEVDRIAGAYAAPAERAAAALRLAQEQVRYLSISMGTGSHAPRAPDRVFAQRFGDCKDKSLLTVSLMRALGLQANVALVHTEMREKLADALPSAGVFDHAIVQAVVDGKTYWLDPTQPPQRAPLDRIAPADFGQALVLSPQTTGLTRMETGDAAIFRRRIAVVFDLAKGPGHRAGFEVTTRYEGLAAERMRNGSFSENLPEYASKALKYYANYTRLAGIKPLAPLAWQDDEQANVVTTHERYDIDDPWERDKHGAPSKAGLPSPEMVDLLRKPEIALRKQPLSFGRGEELIMRVEERVPASWTPMEKDSDVRTFQAQAFSYLREFRMEGHSVHLTQTFRSKSDHVPVDQLAAHAKTLDQAADWIGHDLSWDLQDRSRSGGSGSLGKGILALVGMLALWIGAYHGSNWLSRRRLDASLARNAAANSASPHAPAHRSPETPST
ncbi:DUF3857 domain-containing transglutaminase family protein [Roseateles sp. L2-2]|uniref:DUF3857 domain-containing transglutaminase family protein n=1 Tax=Roseateles sp. L2-2 TaxID=3422597 RepID=UPI003D365C41